MHQNLYKNLPQVPGIYSLINTRNNKRYIGVSNNIQRRVMNTIIRMESKSYSYYLNEKLLEAWKEDKKHFISEVIEITNERTREEYWTRFYNSHIDGYNFSIGTRIGERAKLKLNGHPKTMGFTGRCHKLESIKRMIQSRTGLVRSEKIKERMSMSALKSWETRSKEDLSIRVSGEGNPSSKLNESSVRGIRYLSLRGKNVKEIAEMYSVSDATVRRIINRKIWKHI